MVEHKENDRAYKRVMEEERRLSDRWRQDGQGLREIARRLGRAPSTISRELARNTGERGYRPKPVHEKAQARALRPGPRRFTEKLRAEVASRLAEGWIPEIITGHARLEGRPSVCKETIYQYT